MYKLVVIEGALTLGHLAVAVAVFTPNRAQICQCECGQSGLASLARPGQLAHLGEVCCYGTGRHGTDANEPTRAHARLRNLSWMTYSPCDDHGHNKGDEPSFPLNGKHGVKRFNCWFTLVQ